MIVSWIVVVDSLLVWLESGVVRESSAATYSIIANRMIKAGIRRCILIDLSLKDK